MYITNNKNRETENRTLQNTAHADMRRELIVAFNTERAR